MPINDSSIITMADGKSNTFADWIRVLGASRDVVLKRVSKGWDPINALLWPMP